MQTALREFDGLSARRQEEFIDQLARANRKKRVLLQLQKRERLERQERQEREERRRYDDDHRYARQRSPERRGRDERRRSLSPVNERKHHYHGHSHSSERSGRPERHHSPVKERKRGRSPSPTHAEHSSKGDKRTFGRRDERSVSLSESSSLSPSPVQETRRPVDDVPEDAKK